MEKKQLRKILLNALLSIFIYSLPILLMMLTFYVTGEKPWLSEKQSSAKTGNITQIKVSASK